MKILSIGDIHGKDTWKFYTHESPYDHTFWKTAIDSRVPLTDSMWNDLPYSSFDKIIFLGDYSDAFDKTNEQVLENLKNIIHFKKALGDKVVLLLGNHDIQYIVPNQICSGYRPEMRFDLNEIYEKNKDLFKIAHEEMCIDGSKWLWTHAGVTSQWYSKFKDSFKNTKSRLFPVMKDFFNEEKTVAETINFGWEIRSNWMYCVDIQSGGTDPWAGPLWVRDIMLSWWPLDGYNQIIGHTPKDKLVVIDDNPDGEKFVNFKHYYIDFLGNLQEEPLILDI